MFGTELDQLLIQERVLGYQAASGAPSLVEECLAFLIPAHTQEEGLFRISGMKEDITTLKQKCDISAGQGVAFRFENADENCHNVSGLLKLFIRELPSSLYPKTLQSALIAAGKIEDESARFEALCDVARHLPLSNYALLRRLTCVLHDLLAHVETTKMTAANLSTVWAPNLVWDRETETDPSTCLAFSRDINLAIQYTIEAAYVMYKADEFLDSMTASASGAELPKRRSVFEMESDLERTSSRDTLSGSSIDLPRLITSEDRSSSMMLLDSEDCLTSSYTPRSDSSHGMSAVTPKTPGFEDMLALATSSTKKRPRSIWVGSASAIEEKENDSVSDLGRIPSTTASAFGSLLQGRDSLRGSITASSVSSAGATPGSEARRSIKRRTRVIALDKAAAQAVQNVPMSPTEDDDLSSSAAENTPYAKRRKLLAGSGSVNNLNELSSRNSTNLLEALRGDCSMESSEESIGAPIGMNLLGTSTTSITAVSVPDASSSSSSAMSITAASTASPRKSATSLRASIRKSLRLGSSVRSSRVSVAPGNPTPEVQLYYYLDSDVNSVALRKLLGAQAIIPREIRNAQNDPMSLDEAFFFAKTCSDIVVVRRTDKAYTTSHKIADLSEAELKSFLVNANGEPRAPAIMTGTTFIVGYDKALKEIFKYYLHRTKKTSTPIRV